LLPKFTISDELNKLVSRDGLKPFLTMTRVLVALLSSDGHLVLSNPAFDMLKQTLPGVDSLRGMAVSGTQDEVDRLFERIKHTLETTQTDMDFGSENQPRRYSCLFVPLKDGRVLFFGEPVFTAYDLPDKYQRLMKNFEHIDGELKDTRQALERKQTELDAVIAQADEVSHTDALTLLANRKQVMGELQRQVTFCERYQQPFSISILDFDHFKEINDTYGHSVGDEVLRAVALQLRDHVRSPDIVGRYGGDEFLVLLPNSTVKAASEQAQRLCELVRSIPVVSRKRTFHVTISIGIAQYRIREETWGHLLDRADRALYQAKENGRDQWVVLET